ncbi:MULTISPECIES: hypothetical protein [unclassified Pseudofrankia]|uniref:hypothetical protein n=1 Tax=unclassified Pseudofrankia TaxID=2994372 RepID=UPI0008DAD675|nr:MULTISPECIES: hypothetical protein [unclassified Pseudofrankia]MDT3441234.1 hypothetical protein [Pseudofrankia sp. BMG5.37]MDT3444841.1 hypothetical protein [Pseudofrankia sp. BMG5.37]MDT3445922.1 hypothetical protein [Pseudofrankia sp. BMG5.37]MDT3445958.1 hypothetical protein [Pseudofrankia sp. BMG5.37]MDT3446489.1 hypothetical protein [Pseudofrankia sp. BMG5.37]
MAKIPEMARVVLEHRLRTQHTARWPQLRDLTIRYRGDFAYLDAVFADEADDAAPYPLCRLRYTGQPDQWGFAIYLDSRGAYEDSYLPSGESVGTPEQALNCACGLYAGDPTAWIG